MPSGLYEDCDFDYEKEYGKYSSSEVGIIQKRFKTLLYTYARMENALGRVGIGGFSVNKTILFYVCGQYVNDLKEVRTFHATRQVCKERRAAFLARLVAKYRPIYIQEVDVIGSAPGINGIGAANYEILLNINAIFALRVFEAILGLDTNVLNSDFYSKLETDLLFLFQFRDPVKESLVAKAKLLLELKV